MKHVSYHSIHKRDGHTLSVGSKPTMDAIYSLHRAVGIKLRDIEARDRRDGDDPVLSTLSSSTSSRSKSSSSSRTTTTSSTTSGSSTTTPGTTPGTTTTRSTGTTVPPPPAASSPTTGVVGRWPLVKEMGPETGPKVRRRHIPEVHPVDGGARIGTLREDAGFRRRTHCQQRRRVDSCRHIGGGEVVEGAERKLGLLGITVSDRKEVPDDVYIRPSWTTSRFQQHRSYMASKRYVSLDSSDRK